MPVRSTTGSPEYSSETDPKIVRGLYPRLDEQVLRIVATFPRFVPGGQAIGKKDGAMEYRPVAVQVTLPVRIGLE